MSDKKAFSGLKPSDLDVIIYDFDGVMTDNRVHVHQDGHETVTCNRADGMGVGIIRALGVPQIILSTERNPVVRARADKLGIPAVHGVEDKLSVLRKHLEENGWSLARAMFVGNDVNDLSCLQAVGYPAAPADAWTRAREAVRHVFEARGGEGVVRELAEILHGND
ncbi:KdsC family phosphatase [Desulfovibrio oxyclinae]|uniref:KdsC family phosphatase n=1 Tax=Desulfovibrio oxyclinae TaxID=63560 RepID=UPI00037FFC0F|nr:HAD hydrolase family protein [Desulfovibrio oxyclinae]